MSGASTAIQSGSMAIACLPGHRALRRGRWSGQGRIYLLTATTVRRTPVFARFEPARAACMAMHAFGESGDSRLLAWVLMPDHAHWLVQLGRTETLQRAANRLKVTAARNANRMLGREGAVWSRGFHDRALRREDDVIVAARYVVANPLRAGRVKNIADYPFWDSVFLHERHDTPGQDPPRFL